MRLSVITQISARSRFVEEFVICNTKTFRVFGKMSSLITDYVSPRFLFSFLFPPSCCPEPYPDITFYIHIRRIPGFFLFNIIIPCLVVTSFSVFTFAFPPEFGERVTLVIESFLAMSVVILNVADSIPVTSDATPIIVKILLAAMFQIGLALIANCISLNLYKKTEMPQWVRVFFLHYLARMMCIDTGHPKADVRSTRRIDVKVRAQCAREVYSQSGHAFLSVTIE